MPEIIPAILTASVPDLKKKLVMARECGAHTVQVDFADNTFVPNKTIGLKDVGKVKTTLALEAHMMVERPETHIADAKKKFKTFIFHIEAVPQPVELLKAIKKTGMEAGIAINPKTALSFIAPYALKADIILFLSVEPGFQGKGFIPSVVTKIREFRYLFPTTRIGIDGGISPETIGTLKGLEVNEIVVGSHIWKDANPAQRYATLVHEATAL